jgi:hypothetical protein
MRSCVPATEQAWCGDSMGTFFAVFSALYLVGVICAFGCVAAADQTAVERGEKFPERDYLLCLLSWFLVGFVIGCPHPNEAHPVKQQAEK